MMSYNETPQRLLNGVRAPPELAEPAMKKMFQCLAVSLLTMTMLPSAWSQSYPSKPVKIVVPSSTGGATDTFSRALGPRLTEIWGQSVIIENRAGANQIIGSEYVSKSAGDGYTLMVADAASFVINPHQYKKLAYDGLNGFTPITVLVKFPWVIAANAGVPANNFQELLALAKAKPGTLSYGSFGLGSSAHISVEYLRHAANIDIIHVPYKGSGPATIDLLSGQISFMMATPLVFNQHVNSGKLKFIAAATSSRIPMLPALPTIAESGLPGYEAGTWFALVGSPGIPREVVAKIYADTMRVLNNAAFREQHVTKNWFEVVGNTPEAFAVYLKSEDARWEKLIRLSRVSVEQ